MTLLCAKPEIAESRGANTYSPLEISRHVVKYLTSGSEHLLTEGENDIGPVVISEALTKRSPELRIAFKSLATDRIVSSQVWRYEVNLNENHEKVLGVELDRGFSFCSDDVIGLVERNKIVMPMLFHELFYGNDKIWAAITARTKTLASSMVNNLALGRNGYVPIEAIGMQFLFLDSFDARRFNLEILPEQIKNGSLKGWQILKDLSLDLLSPRKVDVVASGIDITRNVPGGVRFYLTYLQNMFTGTTMEILSHTLLPDDENQSSGSWPINRFTTGVEGYGAYKLGSVTKASNRITGANIMTADQMLASTDLSTIQRGRLFGAEATALMANTDISLWHTMASAHLGFSMKTRYCRGESLDGNVHPFFGLVPSGIMTPNHLFHGPDRVVSFNPKIAVAN